MKKYLKLMLLTATLCMAMSVVTPTSSKEDSTIVPSSNLDVPPTQV